MKRVHLFEFEDMAWFPDSLRTPMTNLIVVFSRLLGVPAVLAALVGRVLQEQEISQIVDLGSGGGGSMPESLARIRQTPTLSQTRLTMTDLYPNRDALIRFNQPDAPHIRYQHSPANALDILADTDTDSLKTMVNSFHHMPPVQAQAILRTAQANRQPLLIYEMAENNIPFAAWCVFLPLGLMIVFLMALIFTPFTRPGWRQLLLTYLIPLIPLCYAWDGQASLPRMYTFDDMDELIAALPEDGGYCWEKGYGQTDNGRKLGTYLLGKPC